MVYTKIQVTMTGKDTFNAHVLKRDGTVLREVYLSGIKAGQLEAELKKADQELGKQVREGHRAIGEGQ